MKIARHKFPEPKTTSSKQLVLFNQQSKTQRYSIYNHKNK